MDTNRHQFMKSKVGGERSDVGKPKKTSNIQRPMAESDFRVRCWMFDARRAVAWRRLVRRLPRRNLA